MLIRCVLLLAFISCVQPKDDFQQDGLIINLENDLNRRFALWPSVHNAATLVRMRRASHALGAEPPANSEGLSEGVGNINGPVESPTNTHIDASPSSPSPKSTSSPKDVASETKIAKENIAPDSANVPAKKPIEDSNRTPKASTPEVTSIASPTVSSTAVVIKDNGTNAEKAAKEWDLTPEATKRGLIVFGGFALLAMAYFIFYRTKNKYNESSNPNGNNESNQFRYGVLQSEDRRDNLELSRVPLTMESDDEEDEDLEIFDLEQKKKSLSYVNLQATDEDIVLSTEQMNPRDQLLLDIDDELDNNESLNYWTNNSNKALL